MRPLVTVSISFYNPGHLLEDAVKSVFCQTFSDWELLLIDDGSTDGSADFLRSVCDRRIVVIADGRNLGLTKRLNQISQLARGEFLARMDADDLMWPERLERQVRFFQDHPDTNIVGSAVILLDTERRILGTRGMDGAVPDAWAALKYGPVMHPTVMGKTSWFKRHPYDETFSRAQDRELFIRRFCQEEFSHIPDPLLFYSCVSDWRLNIRLASYKAERSVLRKYGPKMIGTMGTHYLITRSLAKTFVLFTLVFARVPTFSVLSCARIPKALARCSAEALKRISQVELPSKLGDPLRTRSQPQPDLAATHSEAG